MLSENQRFFHHSILSVHSVFSIFSILSIPLSGLSQRARFLRTRSMTLGKETNVVNRFSIQYTIGYQITQKSDEATCFS
ncbi:hypothetical protein XSR1_600017 [Xenorhabdus szentirmaii DSM 16338]|uniref:Uncharacterized protein n=1 Tax=Xenorhabdus szentirmaii DSM 16338 TaxID=1427518 RepID=W1J336_9GAMM|nr:hypothetical protein XSR1_600017 [Xenorhabdus szentirmaii DSM 16338]